VPPDFEAFAAALADGADDPGRLKAWWVYRMLFGPDPLTERLTLLWHNHFATSHEKVQSLAVMRRQNQTFRELARAPFRKLLGAFGRTVRENDSLGTDHGTAGPVFLAGPAVKGAWTARHRA
jgi:hypothetical protein